MIKKIVEFSTEEMELYTYSETQKEHLAIRKELRKLDEDLSGIYRTHVVEITFMDEHTIRATIHEPIYFVVRYLEAKGWNFFEKEQAESDIDLEKYPFK